MRRLIAVPLWISLGLGCSTDNSVTGDDPSFPPGDPLICVGDPDTQMICKKASELWDCSQMPGGDWKCAYKGGDAGQGPVPPGGGTWSCAYEEFVWVCKGSNVPPGGNSSGGVIPDGSSGGSSGGGSGGGGSSGGGSGGGGSSGGGPVCNHYYAAKWQTNGSHLGSCEAVPGNDQDCDAIRDLLSAGFKAPLTNGACTITPVKVGSNWVVTLPKGCQFVQGGACGKYGGNVFISGSGTSTITLPSQQGTGLSHLEILWCCD